MDGKRSRVGGKLRVTTSTPDNRDEARAQMSFAETEGIDPYDKNIQVAAARGLPKSWGEIAAGHLVIAQASLEYGWWEAVVLARNGDTFTPAVPRLPAPRQVLPTCQQAWCEPPGAAARATGITF